ncbi:hypothetical protein MKK50_15740 [Methylobacterium sp. J-043]|jgi:hypothetical protein|uniref:Uncharacterized protein n=1 Tax=Methylobacterium goesingense TaxID=243690 RepID=A0ABV2L888_9HYPH|nr:MULTISPECIES: hypothetical protein [Methylobacteriaceae]MCJ2030824.1 hypothetical protein [Methylobacterium sp. J-043]UYW33826.1 hypothetical protein OKB92_07025 [Methylorubrum extorquens]GJD74512.1 hypothetical protein CFIICLFH_2746 [Methylobacterium goesingense]
MTTFDFAASRRRIKSGWQAGRTCRLVSRGLAARVSEAERAWQAGQLPLDRAAALAAEAEAVSFSFAPVPGRRPGPVQGLLVDLALRAVLAAPGRLMPCQAIRDAVQRRQQ